MPLAAREAGGTPRQSDPVKIALVSVGADNPHALTNPVIQVDDLLKDREQLREAIAAIV